MMQVRSFILPFLYCRKGLNSCREWRQWEKRERFWECLLSLNQTTSSRRASAWIPICIARSQRVCLCSLSLTILSLLMLVVLGHHCPKFLFLSLCGQHYRASMRWRTIYIEALIPSCWSTFGQQSQAALQQTLVQTDLKIRILIVTLMM